MDEKAHEITGIRERKRQQTFERIAKASLKLFQENGYEATTLDAIAAAAGISRRTFFYYYDSKDDILVSLQCEGFIDALREVSRDFQKAKTPFQAVRDILPDLVSQFETSESIIIGKILESTEALKTQKLAVYVEMENALNEALADAWPKPEQRLGLRLVASMAISALRIAMEDWRHDDGKRPLADYIRASFREIERQF